MKVRLSRQAQTDARAQIDWLVERSPSAARKATLSIFEMLSMLSDYPQSGKAIAGGEREQPVKFGRDGFVIRYEVRRTEIFIKRIYHSRQNRN